MPLKTESENVNLSRESQDKISSATAKTFDNSCLSSSVPYAVSYPTVRRNMPSLPPLIPPRPSNIGYSNPRIAALSSYPYGQYGRYLPGTPYSTYSGVGSSYGGMSYGNRYGFSQNYQPWAEMGDAETAIIRMAEESSRPAFQSIESLVNAFSSISMMLESTYHAVHNSYRAVLGVVENFSRLKNQLAHLLSTLTLIRTLHWLLQRLLYYLRLRKTNPSAEAAWSAAANAVLQNAGEGNTSHSSWPIVIFLSMVFGAPWLIFRIFSKVAAKKQAAAVLEVTEGGRIFAEVLHEFRSSQPGELSVLPGQRLTLAPKSKQPKFRGWVLVHADRQTAGLVPSNYLRFFCKKSPKTAEQCASPVVAPELGDDGIMPAAVDVPPNDVVEPF